MDTIFGALVHNHIAYKFNKIEEPKLYVICLEQIMKITLTEISNREKIKIGTNIPSLYEVISSTNRNRAPELN